MDNNTYRSLLAGAQWLCESAAPQFSGSVFFTKHFVANRKNSQVESVFAKNGGRHTLTLHEYDPFAQVLFVAGDCPLNYYYTITYAVAYWVVMGDLLTASNCHM